MREIISYKTDEIRLIITKQLDLSNNYLDLLNIAESRGDKVILLALEKENSIVAAGLFSRNTRKVLGFKYCSLFLYGYSFFDYNRVFIIPTYENNFFSFVKSFSKRKGVELLLLENVKQNLKSDNLIRLQSHISCFKKQSSENGFDFLINKKSLKRHRNKLINNFNYSLDHLQGDDIRDSHLQKLADLHKERWGFDNIKSAFLEENRSRFYNADKQNRVLTILYLDKEVLAMHYGMKKSGKLIWHTPVLNIKYLSYSPIEVLLYETAKFCKENEVNILDFGIGNEHYKSRFSNDKEALFQYLFPINFTTKVKISFVRILKQTFKQINPLHSLRRGYSKLKTLKNSIYLYKITGKSVEKINYDNSIKFIKITNFSEFVDFSRKKQKPLKRFQYKRFLNADYYLCLIKRNVIVCDGWATEKQLLISEISKTLQISSGYILYDYNTAIKFRRKGYYQLLLNYIINEFDTALYIYSLKNNLASNKAILSVGFKKINKDIIV